MAELVALREIDLGRRRREGKPDDRPDPRPTEGYQDLSSQKSAIWPEGEGRLKRLQSSSAGLRPAPCPVRPSRRQAISKRFSISSAKFPVPVMRVPKRGSLSLPPRIWCTMLMTCSE